ncbi:MAG: formate dehydrogenase subunit alpha [Deltaproteobacteria bacterium]|jgi:formate dehydrogenase alpha subunit|nr:formate dehydrogenase subunit alpha [Deltaproteobacteria bacterium]
MPSAIAIVCPYCGVGCNLELTLDEDGRPVKSHASGRNPELNARYLCVKGFTVHELINHAERLRQPYIRKADKLELVSWGEAIRYTSQRLQEIIHKHGNESIGMLCSGKILNEEDYLCQKFQRAVIGNNHVDNCARLCHGPSEAALRRQLGYGAVSTFLEDYEAAETVFLVGAHTTFTHPVIWMQVKKRAKKGGLNLILADPRQTDLVKNAAVHLKVKPGMDIFWIKALGKIIIEKGWHDREFCEKQTIGFDAVCNALDDFDIEAACSRAGVKRQELEKAAELIHDKRTIFIWGMGLTQHAHGTDNISALVNLALLTGNIGRPGCGLSPLRGQNNVQGAGDMGALPNLLAGHMEVDDEAARVHVGAIWGTDVPSKPGLAAPEMIHDIASGKIRALYVIGENPVVSEPQSNFVAWMLHKLDLLIVQDIFPTETSRYAHIVLPAAMVGEKDGTFTNAARRVQYTAAGLKPPGEARADWQILTEMANALGAGWQYTSTEEIWEEIRKAAPVFSGITHKRLKESPGVFWPCYDESHPGTPRLYEDGFGFRDRRARFMPVDLPDVLMEPTEEYPYVLITGRLLEHFNTGEMSRRTTKLSKLKPASYLDMNPEDAAETGLREDDIVRMTSPHGSVALPLKINASLQRGYLFAPIHFSEPNFNSLMSAVPMDPKARMPALKVVPVKLQKHR